VTYTSKTRDVRDTSIRDVQGRYQADAGLSTSVIRGEFLQLFGKLARRRRARAGPALRRKGKGGNDGAASPG
jgi:hypothetical protein